METTVILKSLRMKKICHCMVQVDLGLFGTINLMQVLQIWK